MNGAAVLVAHVLIESSSVLTRLPHPQRAASKLAIESLARHFPEDPLQPTPGSHRDLLEDAATAGIS